MRALTLAAIAAALTALTACAPVIEGGPPLTLPSGLQETAQIGSITVSSRWLDAESDFVDTFTDEVHEELGRCMWGSYPINLRVHLENLDRAGRVEIECVERVGQLHPAPADPWMIAPAHLQLGILGEWLAGLGDLGLACKHHARHHQRLRPRAALREAPGHQQLIDTHLLRHGGRDNHGPVRRPSALSGV